MHRAGHLDGISVAAGAEDLARGNAGQRVVAHDLATIDDDVADALGVGIEPAGAWASRCTASSRDSNARSRTPGPSTADDRAKVSIMSRCAPASEPPITVRQSFQTSARSFQLSSSPPKAGGEKEVFRSSDRQISSSASKGFLPSSVAIAPTVLPSYFLFLGSNVSTIV